MKKVDNIQDIEQLREIAKSRGRVIEKYENTVNRIVPQSHPAWRVPRGTDKGLLPVLEIFLQDCLQNEDIYNESLTKIATYLFGVIQNGLNGFVEKKRQRNILDIDIANDEGLRNQLARDMASNLVQNDSLLEKWHLMRIEHRKNRVVKMLERSFLYPEYAEQYEKKLKRELAKLGIKPTPQTQGGKGE